MEYAVLLLAGGLLLTDVIINRHTLLTRQRNESTELLDAILPTQLQHQIVAATNTLPLGLQSHRMATVLFFDMSGFAQITSHRPVSQHIQLLHQLYMAFDHILMRFGIERLKTNGDQYIAVAGVPLTYSKRLSIPENHTAMLCDVALLMRKQFRLICTQFKIQSTSRFGIASGAVVSGCIGHLKPCYDVWGMPMVVAARLETTCKPDHIQICSTTRNLLPNDFKCDTRGTLELKGLGKTSTYWLREKTVSFTPAVISRSGPLIL